MLHEVRRSLNIMNGVMDACGVFGLSVPHFLAISIVGMVKGNECIAVCICCYSYRNYSLYHTMGNFDKGKV